MARLFWLSVFLAAIPAPAGRADDFPRDLVTWTASPHNPIFTGAATDDAWDRKIRERGWILTEANEYHLWYTGYNDSKSPNRSLGHATSRDGLSWTRDPANPILATSWVEDVCVVKVGNTYYMVAEGAGDIAHLLTSTDGTHWAEQGPLDIRLMNGEPIPPGPRGTPVLFVRDGVWNLFYERGDSGVWLARAREPGRGPWVNVRDEPVLAMGPDEYDRYAVAMDQVIERGGVFYAYYHANSHKPWTADWTTNIARSRDLIRWEKYAGNPLIRNNSSSSELVHPPDSNRLRLYTMHPEVRVFESGDR